MIPEGDKVQIASGIADIAVADKEQIHTETCLPVITFNRSLQYELKKKYTLSENREAEKSNHS